MRRRRWLRRARQPLTCYISHLRLLLFRPAARRLVAMARRCHFTLPGVSLISITPLPETTALMRDAGYDAGFAAFAARYAGGAGKSHIAGCLMLGNIAGLRFSLASSRFLASLRLDFAFCLPLFRRWRDCRRQRVKMGIFDGASSLSFARMMPAALFKAAAPLRRAIILRSITGRGMSGATILKLI